MINIEYNETFDRDLSNIIDAEFKKYADKNDINFEYLPYTFVAKESDEVVGIISGKSYFNSAHITNLIVYEEHRDKDIGSKLVKAVEEYFKKKNCKTVTLDTYEFQAPNFYKKCGYELEFIREDKDDPKLTKYYFIKHL